MSDALSGALEKIAAVSATADAELAAAGGADALEQFRIRYLGTKGALRDLMSLLAGVPREHKPAVGAKVNAVKDRLTADFEARKAALADGGNTLKGVDVTEPGERPTLGRRHILMQTVDGLTELFARMGFAVAGGPEVEDEFHNFVALNIPASHPARDPLDNFYLAGSPEGGGGESAAAADSDLDRAGAGDAEPAAADSCGDSWARLPPGHAR